MFDILVYLYETYYRPDACPHPAILAKKLSAIGFDDDDISEAINWLDVLRQTAQMGSGLPESNGFRVYAVQEFSMLGVAAVGFIQFLETSKIINPEQREVIIERALAVDDRPISLDKLKIIVLMTLWSQGKETDQLMFEELLVPGEGNDENGELKRPPFH